MVPVARPFQLEDRLTPGWRQALGQSQHVLPQIFLEKITSFLLEQDEESTEAYRLSWLEIVFMLHLAGFTDYPVPGPSGSLVDCSTLAFKPLQPRVAGRLSLVRRAGRLSMRILGLSGLGVSGLQLTDCGCVLPPMV